MKTSLVFSLFLFGIGGIGSLAMAQSAGTFAATGNMTRSRSLHTATLLPDGRVLIAGGSLVIGNSGIPINSAELYDPSTGTFTVTGGMTRASYGQVATLLSDGRVLIAGGSVFIETSGIPINSAELYDPSTGTFTPTGTMAAPRSRASSNVYATLLGNGKVLMTGGFRQTNTPDGGKPLDYPQR